MLEPHTKREGDNTYKKTAERIINVLGNVRPSELEAEHIELIEASYLHLSKRTIQQSRRSARRLLRWLWEHTGAGNFEEFIPRSAAMRPRNVVVTDEELSALMAHANVGTRLLLLLCVDLGIRSGTAAMLRRSDYDEFRRELRFVTKKGAAVTMPVTREIDELIRRTPESDGPLLWCWWSERSKRGQGAKLRPEMLKLQVQYYWHMTKRAAGITRDIRLHDLRRKAAVAMYEATGDVRDVQALLGHTSMSSTIWYLDHDLRPIKREVLEAIKAKRRIGA